MAAEEAKHAFRSKLQPLEALFRPKHTHLVLCAMSLLTGWVCQYLVAHCHLQPPAFEQPSETPKTSCTPVTSSTSGRCPPIYIRPERRHSEQLGGQYTFAWEWGLAMPCAVRTCNLSLCHRPNPTHTLTLVFLCMCTFAYWPTPTHRSLACTPDTLCPSCSPLSVSCLPQGLLPHSS